MTDTHISLLQKQLQVLSTLRAELRRQALLRPSQPDLSDRRPKPLESLPELLDKDGMELDEQMQLQDEACPYPYPYPPCPHTYIHTYIHLLLLLFIIQW